MNTDDCCVAQNAFICVYLCSSVVAFDFVHYSLMRIIAGEFKGRRIPFNNKKYGNARVTSDFVKKAVFSSLGEILYGKYFLDLFSCSGQIGLEACSRGARVVINEPDRRCNRFIAQLIDNWHLNDRIQLYARPAQKLLPLLARSRSIFDIIYLDPPYHQQLDGQPMSCAILTRLTPILAPNARILVQHASRTTLPKSLPNLALSRQKKYGDTTLSTYTVK